MTNPEPENNFPIDETEDLADMLAEPGNDAKLHPNTVRYQNRYRMRVCDSPFVIWFRERTGSTFLCTALNSHPDILCRQEDFDLLAASSTDQSPSIVPFKRKYYRRQLKNFETFQLDPTDEETVQHFRRVFSQPKKACGFKFKFDMQVACYQEVVDELHWISRSLKVFFLTRKNYLKQAVSRQNMERIFKMRRNANLHTDEKLPPIVLDIDRTIRYATYMLHDQQRFENSITQFQNVQRIVYEDMLADPGKVVNDALQFLNVDGQQVKLDKVHKATNDQLSLAVANFVDLKNAVIGTELECFLD